MGFPLKSGLVITALERDKGPVLKGTLRAETRTPRPKPDEGPADYTFTYNQNTGQLQLRVVKWSGPASYVEHLIAPDAREDIRSDLEAILPVVLPLANEFSRLKEHANAESKKLYAVQDAFADLLIELRRTATNPTIFKKAISDYERLVGPLDEAEEERETYIHTRAAR